MFCPNCGNKISSEDNYCKYCGKKIKNVNVTIEQIDVDVDKNDKSSDQSTIVYKPLKLDDINNTDKIKEIIDEVDKKISNNIDQYKSNSSLKENSQGPRVKDTDKIKDFSKNEKQFKTLIPTNKEVEPRSLNEFDLIEKDNNKNKKRRSFKQMWSDFINEDDDEYSIFSSLDEEMEEDNKNIEIASTTFQPESMENTMDIPKVEIEEALSKTKNIEYTKKPKDSKAKSKDNLVLEDLNTNIIYDENNKNYDGDIEKNKETEAEVEEPKDNEFKESLNYKSFTELVNKELEEAENKNKDLNADINEENLKDNSNKNKAIINKFKNKFNKTKKSKDKKNHDLDTEKNIETAKDYEGKKNIEAVKDDKENKDENLKEEILVKEKTDESSGKKEISKNNSKEFINEKILQFNELMTKVNKRIREKTTDKYEKVLLASACVLSILPIFLSEFSLSFSIVLLILIKVLLKLAQFYLSLSVTVDKAWVDTSVKEIKENFIFTYFICELFLFVAFLVSPFNGYLKFDFLSSLTPLPLATILVTILAVLISLWQYKGKLEKQNKIDFIAWYVIVFLIVDFSAKIFFVFANLIISN